MNMFFILQLASDVVGSLHFDTRPTCIDAMDGGGLFMSTGWVRFANRYRSVVGSELGSKEAFQRFLQNHTSSLLSQFRVQDTSGQNFHEEIVAGLRDD